jgi:transcription elongation factor Elf1
MARPIKNEIRNRDPMPRTRDPQPAPKVVHLKQRRCPKCGYTSFRVNGSHVTLGVRTQHCICHNCGYRFPVQFH